MAAPTQQLLVLWVAAIAGRSDFGAGQKGPAGQKPPAAPWAAPGVGLACQAKLNAFCNDPVKDGPNHDGAYNASRAPFFGLFDHNGAPDGVPRAIDWRCYSHGCLNPKTHRFDKSIAGPPSGPSRSPSATACNIATDVGPGALQAICAACAGTTEGVSQGQCLPAPHILNGAPKRLPIQRGSATRFTVTGNFSAVTHAATCRINDQHYGPLRLLNATAATCEMPCNETGASADQNAGCWLAEVEGTATISVSQDGHVYSNMLQVELFHLARAQLGRRPYIDETSGSILLHTDALALGGVPLVVEAKLPCAGKRWTWPNVSGGTDVLLPLTLSGLPTRLHNDICVVITLPSGERLNLWRRFLRVPPLAATSNARIVQVDHEAGGLLVSTSTNRTRTPLLGTGYYITEYGVSVTNVVNAADEHPTNSTATLIREVQRMGRRGITWALIYWCYYVPYANATDFVKVMDAAYAAGVGIIWDFMAPGGVDFIKRGGPYDNTGDFMNALKSNITLVKDHPAVLGYYVCDDCCGSGVARMAQSYALFKALDPYHPTFGAVNCDSGYSFSDGQPGSLPAQVERTVPVLPFNKQPALQLSLDVPMLENYGTSISSHIDDGDKVKGLFQEPKVNCPPNYGIGKSEHSTSLAPLPALPPAQYRTLLWLGVIRGSMVNQLNFDIGCEHPPCVLPQLADTFYSFAAELQALRPSLYAKFGSERSPLSVTLSNSSTNAGLIGRVYRQSATCLHLIVANTDTSRATEFTASFSAKVPQTATVLFTADYSVHLDARNMTDYIGPGQTMVYQIGAQCVVP